MGGGLGGKEVTSGQGPVPSTLFCLPKLLTGVCVWGGEGQEEGVA